MFKFIYTEIFYRPLFNALVFLTDIIQGHSLGIAIILVTIMVRLILFPLQHKMTKTQTAMKELEPEIQKVKEKFKNKKEEQAKATMELYKKHGVNPFSGILLLILQLPILIALLRIFEDGINRDAGALLYSFVSYPQDINMVFLGMNLTESSVTLAALAGLSQYFQVKFAHPPDKNHGSKAVSKKGKGTFGGDFQKMMKTQMQYVFPFVIFFIGLRFSAALTLYWTVMNLFAIVHEGIVRKRAQALKHGEQ